jgi:hypothetical protein
MKVIFGKQVAESLGDRMTILELDTFFQPGLTDPITAYAVLENTSVPFPEIPVAEKQRELHNTMMLEYRRRNWNYCVQALEHLVGKWGGELDSFYEELSKRISQLQEANLPNDWTGIVINTTA